MYTTKPGLAPLLELTEGAGRTMRVIRRNLAFSLLYNAAGVALAMAGRIDPLIAALPVAASSLTVLASSWHACTFRGRAA